MTQGVSIRVGAGSVTGVGNKLGTLKETVRQTFSEALLDTLPQLVQDAHDKDPKVRQAARETLARYGVGTSQDVNLVDSDAVLNAFAGAMLAEGLDPDVCERIADRVGRTLGLKGA